MALAPFFLDLVVFLVAPSPLPALPHPTTPPHYPSIQEAGILVESSGANEWLILHGVLALGSINQDPSTTENESMQLSIRLGGKICIFSSCAGALRQEKKEKKDKSNKDETQSRARLMACTMILGCSLALR